MFEERITVWQADSFDNAIESAERDAREYAATLDMTHLDFAQAYLLGEEAPKNGAEVFSLIRDSNLEPKAYLDEFFDTGAEHQRTAN